MPLDRPLDRPALLAHLRARAEHPKPIIAATYAGLVTRIERGDFDEPTDE
jgi:hypothetical protein